MKSLVLLVSSTVLVISAVYPAPRNWNFSNNNLNSEQQLPSVLRVVCLEDPALLVAI